MFTGPRRFERASASFSTAPRVTAVSPDRGHVAGGTSVTITGVNFRTLGDGTLPTVLFNDEPATNVVVVDQHTITCDTPAQTEALYADITVTVGEQSGTLVAGFTYFEGVITKLVPNYGPIAGGTTVMIVGYNFVTGSTVTFDGIAATDVVFIDSEHIECVTPNHAVGVVDVVIEEPGGALVTKRGAFQYTLLTRGEDIRRQPGITINDVLNNAPNTATFRVDHAGQAPYVGEKIEIRDSLDGNRLLFAGTVQTVDQIYEGQIDQLAWDVQCVDFTYLANRRRPVGVYLNVSVSDVVKDLFAKWAPGFTTDHVQTKLAKVTLILNGEKDLVTVLNELASYIGGGHWYIDYTMDVHFFHIVPANVPPITGAGSLTSDHMTIALGGVIPAVFSYERGYYFMRHTFLYDEGTETSFQAISNVLESDGTRIIQVTDLPIGASIGSKTCVARRIYYNKLVVGAGGLPVEDIQGYVQVDDNVTTSFSSWFGTVGADSSAVIAIPDNASRPVLAFTNHPPGPASAPTASANIESPLTEDPTPNLFGGSWMQFRVACLYRDGSVSFAGPASNTVGLKNMINGRLVVGFNLEGIPIGAPLGDFDVVARFVYSAAGVLEIPNYSINGLIPLGYVWPIPFKDPTWAQSETGGKLIVIPDNETTQLLNFARADLGADLSGTVFSDQSGRYVGKGNFPYGNLQQEALSTDPIPIWPNPDGPYLEDDDPPGDLTDDNPDLLHADSNSQPFTVSVDISQVRNRVIVIGAGSIAVATADVGDSRIQIGDVSSFSPNGGTVRITDAISGDLRVLDYQGVDGVPSEAFVVLNKTLTEAVPQGSVIVNYFQADDVQSQRELAEIELDANGSQTDGIHEHVIVDPTYKAFFQLYMRAYAELELFGWPIVTIRYATRDPKSRSGQTVHVDLSNPPCQGDFLIQQVVIDQVHDESDQLMPRYTVTASSVKYDLNDLLLSILQGNSLDSGVSSAGLVPAAVSSALSQVPSSGSSVPNMIWWHGGSSGVGHGTFDLTTAGAISQQIDADGTWMRLDVTNGEDSVMMGGTLEFFAEQDITFFARIRTGSDISPLRFYAGLTSGPVATHRFQFNNDTQSGGNSVAFRYSTVAGDTTFKCFCNTGASLTLESSGVNVEIDTEYNLKIVISGAGTTAKFYINGTLVATITSDIPTSDGIAASVGIHGLSGADTKVVDIKVFGVDTGFAFYE